MKRFPSLEKFLLLTNPRYGYEGSAHNQVLSSENWVRYHRAAKANWERYGDNGPPPGTIVVMLRAGHGGLSGVRRTVAGIIECDDCPCVELTRREPGGRKCSSVAEVERWWLHMSDPDLVPFENGYSWGEE